eukprot:14712475-Alexandrium_andersonii.AAC.1
MGNPGRGAGAGVGWGRAAEASPLGVVTPRTPEDEDARKNQEASGASVCASVPRACVRGRGSQQQCGEISKAPAQGTVARPSSSARATSSTSPT